MSCEEEQGKDLPPSGLVQALCKLASQADFEPGHHVSGTGLVSHAKTLQQTSAPQNHVHTGGNDPIFLRCKFLDLVY